MYEVRDSGVKLSQKPGRFAHCFGSGREEDDVGYRIVVAQPIEQEIIDDLERLGPVHMNPGPEPLSP